jgi:hypothetical protein
MKIQAITDLLERQDSEEVIELSILFCDIERSLDCKAITEQEYIALMVDVERLKKIIALKENLELNKLIHDAVVGIIELAKLVKP